MSAEDHPTVQEIKYMDGRKDGWVDRQMDGDRDADTCGKMLPFGE